MRLSSTARCRVSLILCLPITSLTLAGSGQSYETEAFDPAFNGVHIPEDWFAQLLDEFNVFTGQRSLTDTADDNAYLMDHTAVTLVVDGKIKLRATFPSNAPTNKIAADVRYLLSE